MNILNQEIKWCRANRGRSGKGKMFEDGFIAGLKQAAFLYVSLKGNHMLKVTTDPDFTKWYNEFLCQDDDGNSYDHLEMAFAAGKKAAQHSVQRTGGWTCEKCNWLNSDLWQECPNCKTARR